jgi:hypothetical protein
MKKTATVACLSVALLLGAVVPSQAFPHHHFRPVGARVFVGVGPVWWGPPYPYWYYPPAPVYVTPPPVIVQEPPVYVQPQVAPAPPAPPSAASESFWYYCGSSKAYYPTVQSCPEQWIKVAPRTQ